MSLTDKHVYEWTHCRFCGQPLPKGFPKPFCDDCSQKIAKQRIDKVKVKGERYEF